LYTKQATRTFRFRSSCRFSYFFFMLVFTMQTTVSGTDDKFLWTNNYKLVTYLLVKLHDRWIYISVKIHRIIKQLTPIFGHKYKITTRPWNKWKRECNRIIRYYNFSFLKLRLRTLKIFRALPKTNWSDERSRKNIYSNSQIGVNDFRKLMVNI